jgi:hypothetical protein
MEEAVKDAILLEQNDDPVLDTLIDLTAISLSEGRPLFVSPMSEPSFYRKYFKPWVRDGIKEAVESMKTNHAE